MKTFLVATGAAAEFVEPDGTATLGVSPPEVGAVGGVVAGTAASAEQATVTKDSPATVMKVRLDG
ncbi:MAG: hypothetical protein ABWZ98_10300 [Nakamurella sp.]